MRPPARWSWMCDFWSESLVFDVVCKCKKNGRFDKLMFTSFVHVSSTLKIDDHGHRQWTLCTYVPSDFVRIKAKKTTLFLGSIDWWTKTSCDTIYYICSRQAFEVSCWSPEPAIRELLWENLWIANDSWAKFSQMVRCFESELSTCCRFSRGMHPDYLLFENIHLMKYSSCIPANKLRFSCLICRKYQKF